MKLAVDCRMLDSGGIGTYFESILPYLLNSFDCILFGNIDRIKKFEKEASAIFSCDCKTFSISELFKFPKKLLAEINKCDFYYTPYCNVPGGIKIPVFTTIHDVVFLDVKGLSSKSGTFIRKCFYQRAINKSRLIFTVSNFSAERIKHHLKIKNKPIVITYNSVPAWFTADKAITEKDNNLIFVGNIKKHKGLHTLLGAFRILLSQNFSGKLLIIGNAENFRSGDETIFNEIKELPKDSIQFTGKVSDSQLRDLYAKSKLLVQPSLYEGFGMPPLEALTMGTNVVLSDIPVFKEIYKDFPVTFFECGNSQDLAEKIAKVFQNPSPKAIPVVYSFEHTAEIIINNIKGN